MVVRTLLCQMPIAIYRVGLAGSSRVINHYSFMYIIFTDSSCHVFDM